MCCLANARPMAWPVPGPAPKMTARVLSDMAGTNRSASEGQRLPPRKPGAFGSETRIRPRAWFLLASSARCLCLEGWRTLPRRAGLLGRKVSPSPRAFPFSLTRSLTVSWRAGLYTLNQALNTTTLSTSHFLNPASGPLPTPQLGAALPGETPPAPPPLHSTRLATVSVWFPSKDGGAGLSGLGMTMGGLRGGPGRSRETSGDPSNPATTSGAPPTVPLDGDSSGVHSTAASAGPGLASPALGSNAGTPTLRRKALSSSFSIPTLQSLGAGQQNPDTIITSRPVRQFRGTSSSFVRSWEGLPLSQPQLRALADTHAGKEALFVFYTMGKGVVWAELGQGRPKGTSTLPFPRAPS